MTHRAGRALSLLVVTSLLAGCGAQPAPSPLAAPPLGASPATGATPGATSAPPTPTAGGPTAVPQTVVDYVIDPETGEAIEIEEALPGPATYEEVLDAGITAGRWDELTGLELVMGSALGGVAEADVPGIDSVVRGELSHLLDRANVLAMSGQYSDDELSGLRRWYELAVPGTEVVELLASTAGEASRGRQSDVTGGLAIALAAAPAGGLSRPVAVDDNCTPVDPAEFSPWGVVEGCYLMYEDVVAGAMVRVLYPAWYEDDASLADLPLRAREAMLRSADTYAPLAEIGDMDVIFSPVNTATTGSTAAVANHDATFGTGSRGGSCPITVFPGAFPYGFEATMAHEAWHCVQRESGYPRGVAQGHAWYREGGAQYFSFLVYPTFTGFGTFDKNSRTTALWDMSYEAWIWWQYLGSRESPRAVADLHQQMSGTADGGRALIAPYAAIFDRFVIEFVAGTIPAPGGGTLPMAGRAIGPFLTVTKNDTGKDLDVAAEAFVAKRYFAIYDETLRVFESAAGDAGVKLSMVENAQRADLQAWGGVFPEVRSKCKEKANYWVVATTDDGSKTGKIKVDMIEEAVCDPCLLGTWDLDLDSFQEMIMSGMDSGGALPPGASFDLAGHYYIAFDDDGGFREQRDGLTISSSYQGFTMNIVIDGFARGTYTADGENVEVINLVDDYTNVSLGGQTFAQDSRVLDGAGTYECRKDDMTVTVASHEPLHWQRVDKILEPPPALEGP